MSEQTYTAAMAVGLQTPFEPRISPDGSRILFRVEPIGHPTKDRISTIFTIPVDGSAPPQALTDSDHNNVAPTWSDTGSQIAFLSDRPTRGTSQLHVVSATGGEPLRLTNLDGGVANPAWVPGQRALAFTARRKALAGEVEQRREIHVASERWRPHAIASIPQTGGAPRIIGPAEGHVWTFAYNPDGTRIAAFVSDTESLAGAYGNARLVVMDADGGNERELVVLSGGGLVPVWSPDGRHIACVASRLPDLDPTNVYVIDVQSGDVTVLNDRGMTPGWVAFDGEGLLVHSVETQRTRMDHTDLQGTEWRRVSYGETIDAGWIESRAGFDYRNGRLAFACAFHNRPTDLYCTSSTGTVTRLTDLNPQLANIPFVDMEELTWQASDGMTIHGWLLLPAGHDERPLPLVAAIHGGPSWQWGNWFHGTWHDWGQLLAANGYAVFMPNPRGSTGRGGAFTGANRFDFGGGDFDDIMTGIEMLIARGVADPERLGICGWSYGGFMTAWAVTHTNRFKAAVAGAACTNWVSKIGTTDIRPFNEWNLGEVSVEPDMPWQHSPIRYVKDATTPTLVVHGEADVRVPVTQGVEFYQALKAAGVETDMVSYPRQGHAFHERAFQLDLVQRLCGWFAKHL